MPDRPSEEAIDAPNRARSGRFRFSPLRVSLIILFALLATLGALYLFMCIAAENTAKEAIAETNRLAPEGWTMRSMHFQTTSRRSTQSSATRPALFEG
jgi:hypothetical protein